LISEHLIREGKFELEEIFNEEAGIIATTEFRNAFKKLHQVEIYCVWKEIFRGL